MGKENKKKGRNNVKRAIATLLSLTMMFSILAQYPIAYGEEFAGSQPVLEETMAINQ